ncbi:Rieske (2Fe-2S) protein [Janibacter sp. GXQ6167]|uniref:Rieske (2Fe-2S) protein n=1 Tax=Janibacter sp. GXQ6167 TaxID=3240791 RepID=UPI003524EE80
MTTPSSSPFSRRVVLGAVAAGAVVPATACGSGSSEDSGAAATRGANGEVRFPAGDVPVGGGRISATERVVVTQPAEGEFKAFSAICPHERCVVSAVTDGTIVCACHQSTFDAATGERTGGPAPRGLDPLPVSEDGTDLVVRSSS